MTLAKFTGAMLGLAYGDAISFPALYHRFQTMPRRRHNFLWRTNRELDEMNITRLTMPFTHRQPAADLEPYPTDDTEFAMLTLRALLRETGEVTQSTFLSVWLDEVVPRADEVRSSFSERAAIENLKRRVLPPASGNDNPLHYEDSAVARAVPIGLYCAGDADRAAALAELDASITQAEDGIYAARVMAVAIALLANGSTLTEALERARKEFPAGSWIEHGDATARAMRDQADEPEDLPLLLSAGLVNTVYSYGSAAPETLPAAFVIAEACGGDLRRAVAVANAIPKSADSLPAMVGAICGALQGDSAVTAKWRAALTTLRGVCLPFMQGEDVVAAATALYERQASSGKRQDKS